MFVKNFLPLKWQLFLIDSLLPYKKRPATTGMVARNLVAGALGIRTNVSSEQRKKEKEMLKEARGIHLLFVTLYKEPEEKTSHIYFSSKDNRNFYILSDRPWYKRGYWKYFFSLFLSWICRMDMDIIGILLKFNPFSYWNFRGKETKKETEEWRLGESRLIVIHRTLNEFTYTALNSNLS